MGRWALLAGILVLASCAPEAAPRKLLLNGSSTVAPLVLEIGKRFEAKHPGVRIDVQTGGSGRGLTDARQGLADLGMVSRALKDDEKDLLAFPIAMDGVCVILHRDNPVTALTDAQVVSIYTGQVTNWKDVGGRDAPITVVHKAEGRSTLEVFCGYYRLRNSEIRAHVVIGDNPQGIKTVAGAPDSIGYVSIGSAAFEAGAGTPIKLLPVSGVAAGLEPVRNGTFPLSRPLNLVVRKVPDGLVKEFLDFARSAAVHDLVREQCFVPIAY
jgi:phosphate transport system substrate-binding protein